jgi:hypothetical protein
MGEGGLLKKRRGKAKKIWRGRRQRRKRLGVAGDVGMKLGKVWQFRSLLK